MTKPQLARTPDATEVGIRARRRVAWRLLPFVFILYIVNYLDRVNVSFANLRMSADLGFSDRVYGLGVAIFYVGYVVFEIPGAIIVERWSARKWIARIMISWGLVTVFTGFIHTAREFYAVRILLGVAEASFFPGLMVYFTHWFRMQERGRSLACLYLALPTAYLIGSPLAGWLLGVRWLAVAGWRWLFVIEGMPAILLGIVTIFYLTDWPAQAHWLREDERDWLTQELRAELETKKKVREYTIFEAFLEPRVLLLALAWFLAQAGASANIYWIPTFMKRLTGLSDRTVTSLLLMPAILGIAGTLLNGWHSDKKSERRWHTAWPLAAAGLSYVLVVSFRSSVSGTVALLLLGAGLLYAFFPIFWSIPSLLLSESAAAVAFGLINSLGQAAGFAGPFMVGFLNQKTHSLTASIAFIGGAYLASSAVILALKIRNPLLGSG